MPIVPLRFSLKSSLLAVAAICCCLAAFFRGETRTVVTHTGKPLDLAIIGDGYFGLTDDSGNRFLTREGRFVLDESGFLKKNGTDYYLEPSISFFSDTEVLIIRPDGVVQEAACGSDDKLEAGVLHLAALANQDLLDRQEAGVVPIPTSSDMGSDIFPGEDSGVFILQGWIERQEYAFSRSRVAFFSVAAALVLAAAFARASKNGSNSEAE